MTLGRAYHAADATPVDRFMFSSWSPERLADLRFAFHPSTFLVQSRFPIVTVWRAQRTEDVTIDRWGAEVALIARPYLDVEVRSLPSGGQAFLGALIGGATVAKSIAAGVEAATEFDIVSNLAVLISSNIVIGIRGAD
jgi:hypothetical protein